MQPATIAGLPSTLKGTASTAELVHILDNVSCETTEVDGGGGRSDTLRPHLVVLDMTTKVNLPGRTAMEQKSDGPVGLRVAQKGSIAAV